jgi:hypothetical protein
MIDFEYPDLAGQVRSVAEGVETGTEQHVLRDATSYALGQAVLGIATPAGNLRPGTGQDEVVAMRSVIRDELVGPVSEERRCQDVGENLRGAIYDQVRRACGGRGKRGLTGLPMLVTRRMLSINYESAFE